MTRANGVRAMVVVFLGVSSLAAIAAEFETTPAEQPLPKAVQNHPESPLVRDIFESQFEPAQRAALGKKQELKKLVSAMTPEQRAGARSRLAEAEALAETADALKEIAQGYLLLDEAQPDAGLNALRVAARLQVIEPGKSDGFTLSSRGYYQMGDYPAAAKAAQEALKRNPNDAIAQTVLSLSEGRTASRKIAKGTPVSESSAPLNDIAAGEMADPNLPVKPPVMLGAKSIFVPSVSGKDSEGATPPASAPGPSPLLPIGAATGISLAAYGVLRSKGTWSRREDLDENAAIDPDDDARWKRHAKAVVASAAIGAAVAYGGPWALPRIGTAMAAAWRYVAPSFQRVVVSEVGAINPSAAANSTQNVAKVGIWSPGKFGDATKNAFKHWADHKDEFPEFRNAKEYVEGAWRIVRSPPPGTLMKNRSVVDTAETVFYNPTTNIFVVRAANGAPKTMFRPNPAIHKLPTNLDYFNAQ